MSVLWFVGFGGWLWTSSVRGYQDFYGFELRNCSAMSSMKRDALRADEPQYDQKSAKIISEEKAAARAAAAPHGWSAVADRGTRAAASDPDDLSSHRVRRLVRRLFPQQIALQRPTPWLWMQPDRTGLSLHFGEMQGDFRKMQGGARRKLTRVHQISRA